MASVVWPLLDDVAAASARAPRLLAGTAEVIETMASLLPEARYAVGHGMADPTALALPGVRAIAAKSGSSRAVVAARGIVKQLPGVAAEPGPQPSATADFADRWPEGAGADEAIQDGAHLTAAWAPTRLSARTMGVTLTLPHQPSDRFRVTAHWFRPSERGTVWAEREGAETFEAYVLEWDADRGRLVATPAPTGPPDVAERTAPATPVLSVSLVASVLAGFCDDEASDYTATSILASGVLTAAAVRPAMRALLPFPDISPIRIARPIEKNPRAIATLWPVLVESVRYAATLEVAPRWLNRILDAALREAPYLREAATRGWIPQEDAAWPGAADLLASGPTPAVRRKLEALLAMVA